MSTNISKKKRDDLLDKIKQIRAFIAAAPQDENTGNLLSYLSELEKDVNGKKYGLVFEEHREEIDEVLDTHTPVLTEDADLFIDHGVQMNFLIEGDNLASLQLLEKTHKGKIDLIYIDPPYNTGAKDFVYDDAFVDTTDGFNHSKWLSFMKQRLSLSKKLLAAHGTIFISIDDNEFSQLKLLCDEVFGANNYVGTILWKKKTNGNNMGWLPPVHDYILCYSKEIGKIYDFGFEVSEEDILKNYSNPDNDPRGPWTTTDLSANHKGPYFPVTNPKTGDVYYPPAGRYWVFNEQEIQRRIADGRIIFGKSGMARPVQRVFAKDRKFSKRKVESWWDNHGMNADATQELKDIFGVAKVFTHPKPTQLIKDIVKMSCSKTATILDFFAGSGTTGHAVMNLNAEDGGTRRFIHASQTKLLSDVMTAGFEENDSCFINWEKLTKKGNNALKDSERTNFLEHIEHALNDGLRFIIIVDESHQNNTIKADEIIQYFRTEKIIRCSATPKGIAKAEVIEIPEEEVIAAGLIKKMLVINQDFPQTVETEDQTAYLLERALQKQRELRAAYLQMDVDVNPLIIVQIPNKSETLLDGVERWFEAQGLTYENSQLAVWLSDRHENLEGIDAPAAPSTAVIIKQAVATGWDCPRAQILVKLRDNMDETFEIQTIGRIRRMPEAKHYGSDLLDSCYLYTFDEKFTAGVKMALDKGALNACTLFLKSEYKDITLTGEQRSMISMPRNPQKALRAIWLYAEENLGVGADKEENRTRLQAAGYILRDDVVRHTVSGETATLDFSSSDMNTISVTEKLNTHKHGRDYHQKIGKIGLEIGMEYSFMNTIIRKLFDKNFNYAHKILALEPREVYAFVLNNADRLRHLVREAMAAEMAQMQLDVQTKSLFEFHIPQSCLFTYNGEAKTQIIYKKNVYQNYLSSAAPRSTPEVKFEKFCEHSGNVEWWYKNGDKGSEYFSIVYGDNSEKQKLFYPDYIVGISGEIWIIETKGGFDRSGNSQDIDIYTPKKFEVLKAYLDTHGLKGGIVRNDATTDELCICMEHYSDDIGSDDWVLLENILG